jgi:general secretion pathway protein A
VLTVAREHTASNGYEQRFGLVARPFSLSPDTRFLFESRSHAEALEHVMSALRQREALVVITGEVGAGKTMLCRAVVEQLERRTLLSNITNPLLDGDDLLAQILDDFGVASNGRSLIGEASRDEFTGTLQRFLASLVPAQAHAVVVIDEAQYLQFEALDAIRLLLSAETGSSKLLHVILVGRPDLVRVLSQPQMRQLNQRVSRRHELGPVGTREVQQYIERRLWIGHGGPAQCLGVRRAATAETDHEQSAGGELFWRVRFTPPAMRAIADLSRGVPRLINVICDRALELVSWQRTDSVDAATVLSAARQLNIRIPAARWLRSNSYLGFAMSILVITGLGWWGGGLRSSPRLAAVQSAMAGRRLERSALETVQRGTAAAGTARSDAAPETLALPESESFTIVVASFQTASRAAALASELEGRGLPAYADAVSKGGQPVLIGPYASRAEAEDVQRQLATGRVTGSHIVSSATGGTASSTRSAAR